MPARRKELIQTFVRDRGHFLGFLRVLCRDAELAEELFQELSVAVIESVETFDPSGDFGAWVRGIARNLYRKALRSERRRSRLHGTYDPAVVEAVAGAYEGRTAEEGLENVDRIRFLRRCIDRLPEEHRRLLRDRYEVNLRAAQIAEACRKTVSAVETAFCRIRAALLRCIERQVREGA